MLPTIVEKHLNDLEGQCQKILAAYPKSKLYVCPILPTKDHNKNQAVTHMNSGIVRLSRKYMNLLLMDNYYGLFSTPDNTLNPRLGRYFKGYPNDRDELYLDYTGLRLLSTCIKHCVLQRKGSVLSSVLCL